MLALRFHAFLSTFIDERGTHGLVAVTVLVAAGEVVVALSLVNELRDVENISIDDCR